MTTEKEHNGTRDVRTDGLPVDEGWAWVVLFGCTMNMAQIFGTLKAFGIYFVEFIAEYEAEVSVASLISGIQQASYSVFALPVLTIGLKYLTCRQASMAGGFLAGLAYIIGSFAPNIYMILATHGFMYGVALSLVFPSNSYLIGIYFERRRSLANAIILAGGSIGGLVLPPLFRLLVDNYSLHGALQLTGALLFHTIVTSMLMRPTSIYSRTPKDDSIYLHTDKNLSHEKLQMLEKAEINCNSSKFLESPMILRNKAFIRNAELNLYISSTDSIVEKLPRSGVIDSASKGDLVYVSAQDLSASSVHVNRCVSTQTIDCDTRSTTDKPVCDFSVLRSPFLRLFIVVYMLGCAGAGYVHVFIPPYARERAISDKHVAMVVSVTNACDFIGRVFGGLIVDRHILRSHTTVGFTQLLAGITILLSPFYQQFGSMLLFGILDGLFAGNVFSLAPAVVVDFLGMDKYRSAMGILLTFQGVALGLTAPVIGLLRDISGTYTTSFFFIGSCTLAGAFLILVVPVLLRNKESIYGLKKMNSGTQDTDECTSC